MRKWETNDDSRNVVPGSLAVSVKSPHGAHPGGGDAPATADLSFSIPTYVSRALATAILRQQYGKDLHNLGLLKELQKQDLNEFVKEWERFYEQDWRA